jgi:nucleotide-binding universal stress UspA family protein
MYYLPLPAWNFGPKLESFFGKLSVRSIMYKRIVLAYDGSDSGQNALLDCRDLAQWSHAELALVAVMPTGIGLVAMEGGMFDTDMMDRERQIMQARLEDGLQRLQSTGSQASGALLVGDTVEEITRYAKKMEADLIVVGHRHLDGWGARWWKSSVSKALITHAHCSVLVVMTH